MNGVRLRALSGSEIALAPVGCARAWCPALTEGLGCRRVLNFLNLPEDVKKWCDEAKLSKEEILAIIVYTGAIVCMMRAWNRESLSLLLSHWPRGWVSPHPL